MINELVSNTYIQLLAILFGIVSGLIAIFPFVQTIFKFLLDVARNGLKSATNTFDKSIDKQVDQIAQSSIYATFYAAERIHQFIKNCTFFVIYNIFFATIWQFGIEHPSNTSKIAMFFFLGISVFFLLSMAYNHILFDIVKNRVASAVSGKSKD